MAIYHLSMKPVTRASGRSAVAAAAYRSGTRLVNERDGLVHDYTRKSGIAHSEIVIPEGSDATWALDRQALWNAAEFAEKRKDARVAREFEVALPHELTAEQRLELTREFAQSLANRFGTAVDFSLHTPDDGMDVRNHHAHILMTTRQVGPDGLGDKTLLERENKWLQAHDLPLSQMQLRDIRLEWEGLTNEHLARAGHDIRIDHRSHDDRGLSIEPTLHVGVHATQMDQRGKPVERQRLDDEAKSRNADLIRENPNQVLKILTDEKSVFDRRDVARTLHRYINDDPAEYQALFDRVMASEELVKLTDGHQDGVGDTKGRGPRYSTRDMVDIEVGMVRAASAMSERQNHGVQSSHVTDAIVRQDRAIQRAINADLSAAVERGDISAEDGKRRWKVGGLSTEQVRAVEHITGAEQLSVVVGYAGAGKSTMLAAARDAWEAQGYSVHGAALAGKAAEGLEESSGIAARTLASWEYGWSMGRGQLGRNDVLVIDEAGMIGSRQLSKFVGEAREKGAKVVLVGDDEQLQAIGAGAAFRSIAEEVGFVSLQDVRRQRHDWQREASVSFASRRTGEGLDAYHRRGLVRLEDSQDAARAQLVADYVSDLQDRPGGSRIAMAHRRADVHQLNIDIRTALQKNGLLPADSNTRAALESDERVGLEADAGAGKFRTVNGVRDFVAGDRIVFLQNDKDLGVKNGVLGTVEQVGEGRLSARLDGKGKAVEIDSANFDAFDHGYATTIHKTQGATVDRSFVLASDMMDRHMTYVAMTRHRDQGSLYAGKEVFGDVGRLKARLGRSGAKETVLDYIDARSAAFAARRGIDNDIVMPAGGRFDWATREKRGEARERQADGLTPVVREETPQSSGQKVIGLHSDTNVVPGQAKKQDLQQARRIGEIDRGETDGESSPAPGHDALGGQGGHGKGDTSAGHQTVAGSRKSQERQTYEKALEAYASAIHALALAKERGEAQPLQQQDAFKAAGEGLDRLRPGSQALLMSSITNDPKAKEALLNLRGDERVRALIVGMAREDQRQKAPGQGASDAHSPDSPQAKASRLLKTWQDLTRKGKEMGSHYGDRARLDRDMRQVAQAIKDDPQVERILTEHARRSGLDLKGRSISQEMERQIRQRDRGKGLER